MGSQKPVSSRYYMHEAMPLVLCGACLILALEYSKKAKDIYDQIVESYRLPDIQAAFNELERELPNSEVLLKEITKDLLDINKQLTEDTPFAEIVNQVKQNLVTTARTSGCLIVLYYNHASRKESLSILPQKQLQPTSP